MLPIATILAGAAALAIVPPTTAAPGDGVATPWSQAVTGICQHALLFENHHEIGTRAGAVAVARDIRASTDRRLGRIAALPVGPTQPLVAARWQGVEHELALVYARTYLRIFEVIDAARTPAQRARELRLLAKLMHAPDRLGREAVQLQAALAVPDCTGGHPEAVPTGHP